MYIIKVVYDKLTVRNQIWYDRFVAEENGISQYCIEHLGFATDYVNKQVVQIKNKLTILLKKLDSKQNVIEKINSRYNGSNSSIQLKKNKINPGSLDKKDNIIDEVEIFLCGPQTSLKMYSVLSQKMNKHSPVK